MGLYSRYTAALLTLVFLSSTATAAVRQSVKPSAKSVIENAITADFQTPNGSIHYVGADKYYALDTSLNAQTGSKIAPTIRPVTSTIGTPSFPYGGGAVMNASPVIAVKPGKVVPISRIATGAKNLLRLTPSAVASSLVLGTLLESAGWVLDELTGQLSVPSVQYAPVDSGSYYWVPSNATGLKFSSPQLACDNIGDRFNSGGTWQFISSTYTLNGSKSNASCAGNFIFKQDGSSINNYAIGRADRHGSGCSSPYDYDANTGSCVVESLRPIVAADIESLNFSGQNVDFYTGLMRDVCTNSPSPDNCYQEMVDSSSLSGPTSVAGPSTSSTTTSTNPDGSTSTTTTTTSTQHDISYGNDHFDVGTKETTTVEKDGTPVSTTITEDTTAPTETPAEEPEEAYTFDDSPLPEVEPFYEPQYPDGLQGVWDSATADLSNSAFVDFLGSFVPSFSGSCPAFGLNMNIASWAAFGVFEFMSLCYVFDFIKIIFLVTALFTSRMIMFGG